VLIGISAVECVNAQSITRSMASGFMREGMSLLSGGQNGAAAAKFEEVWYMDDDDGEIPDVRGMAGVSLCVARLRMNQISAARTACTRVLQMPGNIPQEIRDGATRILNSMK